MSSIQPPSQRRPASPLVSPTPRRRKRKILAVTGLGLAGLVAGLLSGCATTSESAAAPASANAYAAASGNWMFTSGSSARLSSLGGALLISGTSVTGTLHPLAATCASPQSAFHVAGTIDKAGVLSIASSDFQGGTVAIAGALAADRRSLLSPTFTINGGTCAVPALAAAAHYAISPGDASAPTAQQFQPVTGSYTGTFISDFGPRLAVAATLTQPTAPDARGSYHLTGTATFAGSACLRAPVVTDSVVTGNTITATYTDPQTHATVAGSGVFSADASTITVAHWTLTGCGEDSGSGVLTRQP